MQCECVRFSDFIIIVFDFWDIFHSIWIWIKNTFNGEVRKRTTIKMDYRLIIGLLLMMMTSMDMCRAYIEETDMRGKFYRLFWPQTPHVKHSRDAIQQKFIHCNSQAQQKRNNVIIMNEQRWSSAFHSKKQIHEYTFVVNVLCLNRYHPTEHVCDFSDLRHFTVVAILLLTTLTISSYVWLDFVLTILIFIKNMVLSLAELQCSPVFSWNLLMALLLLLLQLRLIRLSLIHALEVINFHIY